MESCFFEEDKRFKGGVANICVSFGARLSRFVASHNGALRDVRGFRPPERRRRALASFDQSKAAVQIKGDNKPGGGTYNMTELNLTGSADGLNNLIDAMCNLGFVSNRQCGESWLLATFVGSPHSG